MKKTVKVLALVSLLGITAIACQKETPVAPLPTIVTRTVDYRFDDGAIQHAIFRGNAEWRTFLTTIFDSVDRGYRVGLMHGGDAAKESVTFSSADRNEAMAWVDSMYNAGYDVTLWYDDDTHQYTGVAQKSTGGQPNPLIWPSPFDGVTIRHFNFYPFEEYLQGTWERAYDIFTVIANREINMIFLDWRDIYWVCSRHGLPEPTYDQMLSLFEFHPLERIYTIFHDTINNTFDTILADDHLVITADSISRYYNFSYRLMYDTIYNIPQVEHQWSVPYHIVPGDSLFVFDNPNMAPHADNVPATMVTLWGPDTLLIRRNYCEIGETWVYLPGFEVFVRRNSGKIR